jgi:NAD(P)-dependent dehydrogenase (short-subunit alcohol dehydrogenase family)
LRGLKGAMVAILSSDDGAYVTGETILVDGGAKRLDPPS